MISSPSPRTQSVYGESFSVANFFAISSETIASCIIYTFLIRSTLGAVLWVMLMSAVLMVVMVVIVQAMHVMLVCGRLDVRGVAENQRLDGYRHGARWKP